MNTLKGVIVTLAKAGKDGGAGTPITIEDDGYAGELEIGRYYLDSRIFFGSYSGFKADKDKNVFPKSNLAKDGKTKLYRAVVKVRNKGEKNFTKYLDNNLRLLKINGNHVILWEIALVSQEGQFFVTIQKVYDDYLFNDDDKVYCRTFEKWKQIMEYIDSKVIINQLPPISELPPPAAAVIKSNGLLPNTGRVLWYNKAQQLGLIITPDGNRKIKGWQITRQGSRLDYYESGEKVSYMGITSPMNVERPTSFDKEAYGVKLLIE